MTSSRLTAFLAGALCALVVGGGTAVAATGGSLILGKSNSAGSVTSLTNKNGTALALGSRSGTPPLKVNGTTKVPNLNADRLDGLSASSFARVTGTTGGFDVTGQPYDLNENGATDTIVAAATCPTGTQMTGGGAMDLTTSGLIFASTPDVDETWFVAVLVDETVTEDPADVVASVLCYSPTGGISGSYRTAAQDPMETVSPALARKVAEAVTARR